MSGTLRAYESLNWKSAMDPETAALKEALEKCRDADMTAIAFLLRPDGRTQYLGPPLEDAEITHILECAAEAFRQRSAQERVLN